MRKFFIFTLLILSATYSNAQKRLTVSAESGGILPIPVFYKGLDAYSNENHKISASIGFSALISCNWHYDRKSYLSMAINYESYVLDLKEFVRFPEDIGPGGARIENPSFLYSNFDAQNLSVRISFGNTISQKIKLNTGFQLGLPLNQHFRYTYYGARDTIDGMYNYETNYPFLIFVNAAYQWYETKILAFTLIPEFAYNLQKDAKTYDNENQIRKMYFALRVGVGLK